MSVAQQHDGVWERRVAAAVHAAYAEADLRLEALQLDLLEPRGDGTRWTAQQVKGRRRAAQAERLRASLEALALTMGSQFAAVVDAAMHAVQALSQAFNTPSRDDYTLAGPSQGSAP